jgi:hypothetical protein
LISKEKLELEYIDSLALSAYEWTITLIGMNEISIACTTQLYLFLFVLKFILRTSGFAPYLAIHVRLDFGRNERADEKHGKVGLETSLCFKYDL